MIDSTYTEWICIESTSATDFQDKINKAFQGLAVDPNVRNVRWELNKNMGHCLYIYYDRRAELANTAEERFNLRGEYYYCVDCPFYRASKDKRVVYTICGKGRRRTAAKNRACEEFYEMLERGEIESGVSE